LFLSEAEGLEEPGMNQFRGGETGNIMLSIGLNINGKGRTPYVGIGLDLISITE